jgi:hypothetical protein
MTAVRLAQRPRPARPAPPTIVQAMNDPGLFQPWFSGPSWDAWRTVLKAAFALPMHDAERQFFRSIADREPPMRRVREAWLIVGRRGGKDSIASLIAGYTAALFEPDPGRLGRGERALVSCLACDREQAKIVLNYTRAYFAEARSIFSLFGRASAVHDRACAAARQ